MGTSASILAAPGDTARGPAWADELCETLLATLGRRDQRDSALWYLQGLLGLDGRKTMSAIAELFGGGAVQQRLQHFISNSSWDWIPVREALYEQAVRRLAPSALVVRQMVVPKSGTHSVGVERRFVRRLGLTMNSQQAYGTWLASGSAGVPVNWKLALPESWLGDADRRRRAGIPDCGGEAFRGDLASRSVLQSAACGSGLGADGGPEANRDRVGNGRFGGNNGNGGPERALIPRPAQSPGRLGAGAVPGRPLPVVFSPGELDLAACLCRFEQAGVPVLVPVDAAQLLAPGPLDLPGQAPARLPARQLAELLNARRNPVYLADPADFSGPRRSCALTVPVALPSRPDRTLRLLAEWDQPGRVPDRLWLTDDHDRTTADLLRLTKLVLRVDRDFDRVARDVGVEDFEGRSFPGWHRHITLASVAHALRVFAETGLEDDLPRRELSVAA